LLLSIYKLLLKSIYFRDSSTLSLNTSKFYPIMFKFKIIIPIFVLTKN
jgi:hypothetical protein